MTHLIYLFAATFGVVFFLGLQSLTVNSGHRWMAFGNSLVIGCFNLFLYKTVPNVQSAIEVAVYVFAGPLAIMTAMMTHDRIKAWLLRGKKPPAGNRIQIKIDLDASEAHAAIAGVHKALDELHGRVRRRSVHVAHDGPQIRLGGL